MSDIHTSQKGHDLDFSEVDDLDEISGDQQLALVYCNIHKKHEWHWVDRDEIR